MSTARIAAFRAHFISVSIDWPIAQQAGCCACLAGLTGTQGHVLVALVLNIAAFCAAAACLHRYGARMLAPDNGSGNDGGKGKCRTADLALLLFCCNPASVFYSAAYTEAMFAACTWAGLLLLPAHHWAGVAALTAAAATRSNGILGVWFPLHKLLMYWRRQGGLRPRQVLQAALSSIAILAPYAAMQGVVACRMLRLGILQLLRLWLWL